MKHCGVISKNHEFSEKKLPEHSTSSNHNKGRWETAAVADWHSPDNCRWAGALGRDSRSLDYQICKMSMKRRWTFARGKMPFSFQFSSSCCSRRYLRLKALKQRSMSLNSPAISAPTSLTSSSTHSSNRAFHFHVSILFDSSCSFHFSVLCFWKIHFPSRQTGFDLEHDIKGKQRRTKPTQKRKPSCAARDQCFSTCVAC